MRWLEIIVVGIYVFEVTHSAFQASFIAMLRMLPFAPAGSVMGALAERFGLRRTYLAMVGMILVAALLQSLLALTGLLQVWHLALGALIAGVYWTAELPLRRTLLAASVRSDRLVPAMALDTLTNNLTKMLGPLVGGIMLQAIGLAGTFFFAVIVHAASIWLVLKIAPDPRSRRQRLGFWRNLREGVALARTHRPVLLAMGLSILFNLFGFPGLSMIPVVGDVRLELSAAMIGVLSAAEGIGAALGALLVVRFGYRIRFHGRFCGLGVLLFLLMIALFSFATDATFAWLALFGAGLGIACFSTMQSTLVLMSAPEAARGQLMGLLSISIGVGPVGFLLLGWTAEQVGAAQALRLMVLEGLIFGGVICWRLRDVLTRPMGERT